MASVRPGPRRASGPADASPKTCVEPEPADSSAPTGGGSWGTPGLPAVSPPPRPWWGTCAPAQSGKQQVRRGQRSPVSPMTPRDSARAGGGRTPPRTRGAVQGVRSHLRAPGWWHDLSRGSSGERRNAGTRLRRLRATTSSLEASPEGAGPRCSSGGRRGTPGVLPRGCGGGGGSSSGLGCEYSRSLSESGFIPPGGQNPGFPESRG